MQRQHFDTFLAGQPALRVEADSAGAAACALLENIHPEGRGLEFCLIISGNQVCGFVGQARVPFHVQPAGGL